MGFTPEQASRALKEASGNVEEAIHLVLQWSDGRGSHSFNSRGYNDKSDTGRGSGRNDTRPERGQHINNFNIFAGDSTSFILSHFILLLSNTATSFC